MDEKINHLSGILPLQEPLLIFVVLIGVILLAPFLFRLLRTPDLAAFIIAGIIIGPYGLNILARDSSIELLGTIGLLYIMFVAGLELDPDKLKINRTSSIIFGISTFIFPFILGFFVSSYILQLESQATIIVSIMFSTHTLVAYPIVRKLGVQRDISVLVAIGGTIITDTLVLIIFSIITQTVSGNSVGLQILKIVLLFGVYVLLIFYTYPKITQWFFKHIKRDRPVHFLFLLFMVGLSSVFAEIIGVEAIIGAFVAGLALNRSIPKNSLLMSHVDFVGNILFIPVFLIGIGMLIDTRILFSGIHLWYVSAILIVAALAGKWIASYISQKLLGFSLHQRNLLFGLTSSHAAATIAIILIGYKKQIIDETIFNATILIILVSSLVATLLTEKFGKKLALLTDTMQDEAHRDRVLVPISNPANMGNLVAISTNFQDTQSIEPVFLLSIVNDDKRTEDNISKIRKALENNVFDFNHLNERLKVITRIDLSVSGGILRAAKEYMVSDIVIGWSEKTTTSQRIFGSIFDHLLNGLQTLYAVSIRGDIYEIRKVIINLPNNLEHEPAFVSIISRINKLPIHRDGELEYRSKTEDCLTTIKAIQPKRTKHPVTYLESENNLPDRHSKTLNIMFFLRKQSISYDARHNGNVKKIIASNQGVNFIIIVPGSLPNEQ